MSMRKPQAPTPAMTPVANASTIMRARLRSGTAPLAVRARCSSATPTVASRANLVVPSNKVTGAFKERFFCVPPPGTPRRVGLTFR